MAEHAFQRNQQVFQQELQFQEIMTQQMLRVMGGPPPMSRQINIHFEQLIETLKQIKQNE